MNTWPFCSTVPCVHANLGSAFFLTSSGMDPLVKSCLMYSCPSQWCIVVHCQEAKKNSNLLVGVKGILSGAVSGIAELEDCAEKSQKRRKREKLIGTLTIEEKAAILLKADTVSDDTAL